MPTLADAIRGLVRRSIAKGRFVKRVEVIGVIGDGSGTHLLADGQVATVTGHGEFQPREIVDVIAGREPKILGHKWQKGDVPTLPRLKVIEEVEEIIVTTNSNPDGGMDHFLRSHRGLFYLDVRSAVSAVISDPTRYIPSGATSRFLAGGTLYTRLGANDNTFAILAADSDSSAAPFIVIYVFQINRRLGSDAVPTTGDLRTIGSAQHPIVDLSLIGLYDLALLSVPTGVHLSNSATARVRQNYYFYERIQRLIWDGFFYNAQPTEFVSFGVQTLQDQSQGVGNAYDIIIDFAHNNLTPSAIPSPYNWNLMDLWLDAENRPVLNLEIRNNDRAVSGPFDWMGYDAAGNIVPLSSLGFPSGMQQGTVTADAREFAERPTMLVRLTKDSIDGTIMGVVLGETCPDAMSQSANIDTWVNVPGSQIFGGLLGTLKETTIKSGGGPSDGTVVIFTTEVSFTTSSSPPGGTEVGSIQFNQTLAFNSTVLGKSALGALFTGGITIGQTSDVTSYIRYFTTVEYLRNRILSTGFASGGPPATRQRSIAYGWSRPRSPEEFDCLLFLRHFDADAPTGLWRVRDGVDSAIVYPASGLDSIGFTNFPNPLLSRKFILLDTLRRIDNSESIPIPAGLGGAGNLAMLNPDRLYDKREGIKKFLDAADPSSELTTPKALADLTVLAGFTILDSPSRILHTVGTRTRKE